MAQAQACPQIEADAERELKARLMDQKWRLNNLYSIINKEGRRVQFHMNQAQETLFDEMWYLNIILKARQFGGTTFTDIFYLDSCLFNSNHAAGIIAHHKDDAAKIFETKVLYPWRNMHPDLRRPATTETKHELVFDNNSSIRIGTSMRSSTLQKLHISEFGKICAKYPDKAKEIVTGALNTVQAGQIVTIESTAEGRGGYFYEYCMEALRLQRAMKKLTAMDWKIFFFPWFDNPDYQLDPEGVVLTADNEQYFEELLVKSGIKLTDRQKAWYVKKQRMMEAAGKDADSDGEDMKREYPATPEEAFYASVAGAFYGKHMTKARGEGRILDALPHDPSCLVHTAWDIGFDCDAIWFFQVVGPWVHVIDYYETEGEGLPHCVGILEEKREKFKYHYGRHFGPHDINNRDWGTANERSDTARNLGINFTQIPRILTQNDGIEAVRKTLPKCRFDAGKCDDGIKCLDSYRKEWDDAHGCFKSTPLHDWASHGAKAFESLAFGLKHVAAIASSGSGKSQNKWKAAGGYGG